MNPNRGAMFTDMMFQSGHGKTKLRRREFANGTVVAPGLPLLAFEEIKLDDVPIAQDFGQILVFAFDSTPIGSTSALEVVRAHGWRGSLGFEQASRTLHNVIIDPYEEEIFMDVDPGAVGNSRECRSISLSLRVLSIMLYCFIRRAGVVCRLRRGQCRHQALCVAHAEHSR